MIFVSSIFLIILGAMANSQNIIFVEIYDENGTFIVLENIIDMILIFGTVQKFTQTSAANFVKFYNRKFELINL